jgi:hypothetical protein
MPSIFAGNREQLLAHSRDSYETAVSLYSPVEREFFYEYGINLTESDKHLGTGKQKWSLETVAKWSCELDKNRGIPESQMKVLFFLEIRSVRRRLLESLAILLKATKSDITGKLVCNIGCGAKGTIDSVNPRLPGFEPWLSRFLAQGFLNINSIGIDYCIDPKEEKFEAMKRNLLTDPHALDDITTGSVDILIAQFLWDSPILRTMIDPRPSSGVDVMMFKSLRAWNILQQILRPQIARIMNPNGVIIVDHPHCIFEGNRVVL